MTDIFSSSVHPISVNSPRRQQLDDYYTQVQTIILARQDPVTGLLPASTAVTVHGDYRHAWVRDNVYSILAVWGLALAYRHCDDDDGRAYYLEQSVVKLMRGLLMAMMKQAIKVERFKHSQNPLDALHAKYDTRTGEPVVSDDGWGHLQLDATALFLQMLAQMTASGLRIVFTLDEVDFIQNLVHYLSRAPYTADYGIWERGHKMNEGRAEINASSVGMVKAALETLSGFDLFGAHGSAASLIHVPPDAIARVRNMLEALLPRESDSKETDAALLSIIGFPAYAVEDAELVARTRSDITSKLQGRYGCKRFLRDGHQTVLEDGGRLHYESGELARFEHIESEWPLFFAYLLLDAALRSDTAMADDYHTRLQTLLIDDNGQRLLPELYYVPADLVEAEKAQPHSQPRLANENVPLVWAQSLYMLGVLVREGFISAGQLDPLERRLRIGKSRDICIQVALLAEDGQVRNRLLAHGIATQTLDSIQPLQVRQASQLAAALEQLGRNQALELSGQPPQRLGSLMTSQVFNLAGGESCLFLPPFLKQRDFYLNLDNRLLAQRLKTELVYIRRHWDRPGQPLLSVLITDAMLQAGNHQMLLDLLKTLQTGDCDGIGVNVGRLEELLPVAARVRIETLNISYFHEPSLPQQTRFRRPALKWGVAHAPGIGEISRWREQSDERQLLARLAASDNPCEQIELLEILWQRSGADADTGLGGNVRELTAILYESACRARLWSVIRRCAGLLNKADEALEDALADILAHQHQLAIGCAYDNEALITQPMSTADLVQRIQRYGGEDPRSRVLIQEIILFLGMLIKTDPASFRGTLTLRAWHLLLLLTGALAREHGIGQSQAFERLLTLSPHSVLERLQVMTASGQTTRPQLIRLNLQTLPQRIKTFALQQVRFTASDDPQLTGAGDWAAWREVNGVLTRLPEDFYPRVWEILQHCHGLIIGNRLDSRNRLDSAGVLADTTPAEKSFALHVEYLLNNIQLAEYRQLCIEALLALSAIVRANPQLRVNSDAVLDMLLDSAVQLSWRGQHSELSDEAFAGVYNEHCGAVWQAFYASAPHQVANAVMAAVNGLIEADPDMLAVA